MNKSAAGIRVSVVMATYNGEKYIRQQLESILKNLTEEDELIVTDDGSSDQTVSILKEYTGVPIRYLTGPGKGVMKNFEHGIRAAQGRIVVLSDQDDVWEEDKISCLLEDFASEKTKAVVHDVAVVDEAGNIMMPSFFHFRGSRSGVWKNLLKNSYLGCAMAFRGEMKEKILPIPTDPGIPDQWHDQWIGLLCDCYGDVFFDQRVLGHYRRHGENKSSFHHGSVKQMLYSRIKMALLLISRRAGRKRI